MIFKIEETSTGEVRLYLTSETEDDIYRLGFIVGGAEARNVKIHCTGQKYTYGFTIKPEVKGGQ